MRAIKNWVLATFILSFLVIIAGGVVRTTQSGMGCPDWPRCFGKWIPPTSASELPADFEKYLRKQDIDHHFNALHTWIEYLNRLLGVLLGMFALIQFAWLFRQRSLLSKPFRISMLFLAVVILTGLFGAVVVKLNLAHVSISIHLLFAIVLLQIQLALLLSLRNAEPLLIRSHLKKALLVFLIALLIQSTLGTMVRMYVDDVSKTLHYGQRESWLINSPLAFIIHRSFSWLVLLLALYLARAEKNSALKYKMFTLAGIVISSMITGITLFYADMPATAQPIHLLLATLAITQSVSILLQTKSSNVEVV